MLEQIILPDATVFYDMHFVPMAEADQLFRLLLQEIAWQQRSVKIFGRSVAQPRLTAWYGETDYTYSGLQWKARLWTPTLMNLKTMVEAHCGEPFNSALANLYRNGLDSVGWHSDDEPELGTEPTIASVSLGASRNFRLRHKAGTAETRILLSHGSLLLMKGPTQLCWKHALPKERQVEEPRINLTFRHIRH